MLLVAGLFTFVLALQLLKHGAAAYGPAVIQWLHISNTSNALGFGWLLAHVFLSGSPVAATAVSLFASGTISDVQTFTMITGSRLGAAFIVLLTGFLYTMRGYRQETSIATGVLALLTTAAIYLPALGPGYWLLTSGVLRTWQVETAAPLESWLDHLMVPIVHMLEGWLPGWAFLGCGLLVLLVGFSLIDQALPTITPEHRASLHIARLVNNPIALFLLGAAITSVTLSVSVSLSLLVPLSAKRLIQPRHMLPYIMGANVTTFIDTLVAALIIGGPAAFTIVLVEMVSVTVLSLVVLLCCYRHFERMVLALQAQITRTSVSLALFVGAMLLLPVLLLVL
jgi:hypothetical protein